jgi:hypothetical protein
MAAAKRTIARSDPATGREYQAAPRAMGGFRVGATVRPAERCRVHRRMEPATILHMDQALFAAYCVAAQYPVAIWRGRGMSDKIAVRPFDRVANMRRHLGGFECQPLGFNPDRIGHGRRHTSTNEYCKNPGASCNTINAKRRLVAHDQGRTCLVRTAERIIQRTKERYRQERARCFFALINVVMNCNRRSSQTRSCFD